MARRSNAVRRNASALIASTIRSVFWAPDAPRAAGGTRRRAAHRLDSAAAAADGDLATHWVQDIVPTADGWLQIDLPEPHPVRRIRLRLGPHYGDYPRHYRVDASTDGVQWAPLTPVRLAEPPLRGLLHDSGDLSVDLEIPVTSTARLRVVRPARTKDSPVDLFSNWLHWGVHEVELYEAADS